MDNMFSCIQTIAERKIREAIERGDLDNLPGKGKPLELEDDSWVPQDLRMAYRILKNSGFLPPELEIRREIERTADLISHLDDEYLRYRQIQKLEILVTKANMMRDRPVNIDADLDYYRKVLDRIRIRNRDKKRKQKAG